MIATADTLRAVMGYLRAALPRVKILGPGQAFRRPIPCEVVQVVPRITETEPQGGVGDEVEQNEIELRCYAHTLREGDHEDGEDDPLALLVDKVRPLVDGTAGVNALSVFDADARQVAGLFWGPTRTESVYGIPLEAIGTNTAQNVHRALITASVQIRGCGS